MPCVIYVLNISSYLCVYFFPGKGLTLVTSVLEGKWKEKFANAQAAKQV